MRTHELCGWLDWPEQREQVLRLWGNKRTFSQAAPHLMTTKSERKDIFSYKAFIDVLGAYPEYPTQDTGDCVSFGTSHSLDLRQCIQCVMGERLEYKEICTEWVYAKSRQIAGLIGKRGAGSTGVAAAEAIRRFGVLSREDVGPYSGERAVEWGYRNAPEKYQSLAQEHPCESALITTLDELDAAIDNAYTGAVGSDVGFEDRHARPDPTSGGRPPAPRNADGVVEPFGRWMHLMGLGWCRITIGRTVYYGIPQSWGPNVPSGPTPHGLPNFCFLADERTVARMVSQGDAFVMSSIKGWPARVIPASWTYAGVA